MKNIFLFLSLILITQDLLGQFQTCNSPTSKDLFDVWFINQDIGIAVGDSGTILRSINGGFNWSLAMSNDTINFKKVKFFDTLNGIAIGSDIYITNDAGVTWSNIPHGNDHFYDVEILNQTTCIISGEPIALIKSINNGLTFNNLVDQQNDNIGLLSFVNENIGYACNYGAGGRSPTLKTIDGGVTWATISNGENVNTIMEAMSFTSEAVGFKGGWYSAYLQKTSDNANSWNSITYDDSLTYGQIYDFHIEPNQPNSFYACGWYGQIFKSMDGGDNWFELSSGLPNTTPLYGIYFVNDSIGWAVGQNGTIIKTTNGVTVGLFDVKEKLKLSLFPNPAEEVVYVNNQKDYKILQIGIYDINGQRLISENYNDEINLSSLLGGMYIIEVKTDKGDYREKIIKE